jgi:hypothetical protein
MLCQDTNPVVLKLKVPPDGTQVYDFSPLYPQWSRGITIERDDPQGPGIIRVDMTLHGFFLSEEGSHEDIINRFIALESFLENGMLLLEHRIDDTTLSDDRPVYTNGINKPENWDTWNGEFSFSLYYFKDSPDDTGDNGLQISANYVHGGGTYTFEKTPVWSHGIRPNRASHRAENLGSTATITLRGRLFADSHEALMTKIGTISDAFNRDGILNYGEASYIVRAGGIECGPSFPRNHAPYTITLHYDIGTLVHLSAKTRFSRIHQNPLIKEKPLCNERIIKLRNTSGQTVSWSISITAADIATARALLTTELSNRIFPGGVELAGGEEEWDEDSISVQCTVSKFYDTPVLANMSGTG